MDPHCSYYPKTVLLYFGIFVSSYSLFSCFWHGYNNVIDHSHPRSQNDSVGGFRKTLSYWSIKFLFPFELPNQQEISNQIDPTVSCLLEVKYGFFLSMSMKKTKRKLAVKDLFSFYIISKRVLLRKSSTFL